MILEWDLFLRLSLWFVRKFLSFLSKVLPKRYLFIFCMFYLNEELIHKYVWENIFENKIFKSTSTQIDMRRRAKI